MVQLCTSASTHDTLQQSQQMQTDLPGSANLPSGKDIGTLLPHFPHTKSIEEASGCATLHRTTVPLMVTMRPERKDGS